MNNSISSKPNESPHDRRRKAPFHFLARADNARMCAFSLSHINEDQADEFATSANYTGDTQIAFNGGFRREASIAIELILKAIICVKNKSKPRAVHDVYELWTEAGLGKPTEDDAMRLAMMTEILYWSGRYAAPLEDKHLEKSEERFRKHQRTTKLGKLDLIQPTPLTWDDFNALYQTAHTYFWRLNPNDPENFVS